jgi:hypothetical protein
VERGVDLTHRAAETDLATMKFKFCGDADAPDWVLGEMATLSKISSVRVKLLLGQIVKGQLSGSVDYEKLAKVRMLHERRRRSRPMSHYSSVAHPPYFSL